MTFSHLYSSALTQELGTADIAKLFTTARRQQAVNNGQLAFVELTECAVRQSTIVSSHGVREYNLLSTVNVPGGDFLCLSKQGPEYRFVDTAGHVQSIAGKDFPRRDLNWLNDNQPGWRDSTGGTPSAYYERPDGAALYFGFDTPPQLTAGQSGLVILPYVAKPVVMGSLGNNQPGPFVFAGSTESRTDLEPYHMALAHYAAFELEKLRGEVAASATQWQLFTSYADRVIRKMTPKGGRTIRQARNYFSEARTRRWDRSGLVADPWG